MQRITIATRQSPLALWQAEFVKAEIERFHPQVRVEINGMTTRADEWLKTPLAKLGGKGLFVKELEEAMLAGLADIAVHSMKDVPMDLPPGLELQVICDREDPTDAFVSNNFASFDELPQGAVLGTSSLRRQCQLMAQRPDLQVRSLRGNVNTRLRKLDDGEFDAIVLASAGLKRLEMGHRIRQSLPIDMCLPAGGQGAVGIEARSDDPIVSEIIRALHHEPTAARVIAERALNKKLNGSCQVPIACHAVLENEQLFLQGLVGSADGSIILRAQAHGPADQADALGKSVADALLQQGARDILDEVHEQLA